MEEDLGIGTTALEIVDRVMNTPSGAPCRDEPQNWNLRGNYWCDDCENYVTYGGHPHIGGTGCGMCQGKNVEFVDHVSNTRAVEWEYNAKK